MLRTLTSRLQINPKLSIAPDGVPPYMPRSISNGHTTL